MRKLFVVLCLALWPGCLPAADQQFTFALPELEGRISLGIFSPEGRLVRTLAVGATESDFKIGLNGLITTWDGKDDAGNIQPAGKYIVRGFVIGAGVKTEGEAFHFNDWVEDETSPRMTQLESFARVPGGFVFLAKLLGQGSASLLRFDQEGRFLWQTPLAVPTRTNPLAFTIVFTPSMLTATDDHVAAVSGGTLFVLQGSDGRQLGEKGDISATAIAAFEGDVFLAGKDGLTKTGWSDFQDLKAEPILAAFTSLAVAADRKVGAVGSSIWLTAGGSWNKVEAGATVTSLSLGVKNTFWITGKMTEGGDAFTGQFDEKGELLRAYRSDFAPRRVQASVQEEEITVLEEQGVTQRLLVLKFAEKKDDASSDWEIVFEKRLTPCANFGLVDGKLVAEADKESPRPAFTITLATGGLTASAPKLAAQVIADGKTLWLATANGLKLQQLAEQSGVTRILLAPGPDKDSRRIYAGDGAVVAEYLVTGLGDIAEIEAGEIEIP